MLGKLIKYEWKSIGRMGLLMVCGTLIASLFAWITFKTPMWTKAMSGNADVSFTAFDFLGLAGLIFYVLLLMAITYGMIIYLGVHFYKSMYTNQGYLTHTLPATPHQILLSKVLVGGLWNLLISLLVVFSVGVLMASFITTGLTSTYPGMSMMEIFRALEQEGVFERILEELHNAMGVNTIFYIVFIVLTLILGSFYSIAQLFGAITIGQLSGKYKGLMAVVAYLVVCAVNFIISTIISALNMFHQIRSLALESSEVIGEGITVQMTYASSLVQGVLMGVLLYFLAHYIVTKKLNLE